MRFPGAYNEYVLSPYIRVEKVGKEWVGVWGDSQTAFRMTGDAALVIELLSAGERVVPEALLPVAEVLAEHGVLMPLGLQHRHFSRRHVMQIGVAGAVGLTVLSLPTAASAASFTGTLTAAPVVAASPQSVTPPGASRATWRFTNTAGYTFTVNKVLNAYALVVGGGGGGGGGTSGYAGGGGGGGGVNMGANDDSTLLAIQFVPATTYTVAVGTAGTGGSATAAGQGGNSSITGGAGPFALSIIGYGGAPGFGRGVPGSPTDYGSGGGGGYAAGVGNGPTTGSGKYGGTGGQEAIQSSGTARWGGGGGGGASGNATDAVGGVGLVTGGNGGAGLTNGTTAFGFTVANYAGGGGGAGSSGTTGGVAGTGSSGTGGKAANGTAAAANTGGGGGGGGGGGNNRTGGAGGTGFVIVRVQ